MTLEEALAGMNDARAKLSSREALLNPVMMSEQMYRLGQYTAEVEGFLGEAEEEYEIKFAQLYSTYIQDMSATAAKQKADVDLAKEKGAIKKLTHFVSAGWKAHTGAMARINHINNSMKGSV